MSAAEEWLRRQGEARWEPIKAFSETGGDAFAYLSPSTEWTVFPIPAGKGGHIEWNDLIGDPFSEDEA